MQYIYGHVFCELFFFSSRRRHTRLQGDWSSDVCSSDLGLFQPCKASHPSLLMAVARFAVRELLVLERQLGAAARGAQLDRHDRLALGRAFPDRKSVV